MSKYLIYKIRKKPEWTSERNHISILILNQRIKETSTTETVILETENEKYWCTWEEYLRFYKPEIQKLIDNLKSN